MTDSTVIEPEIVDAPKRPVGRPTIYNPNYCDTVYRVMSQGETLVAFAVEIGVAVSTVYLWQEEHPEFMEACQRARDAQQRFMERKILAGLDSRTFQASAALTFMRALFPHYREALSNSPQVAVQVNNSTDPQLLATARDVFKMLSKPQETTKQLEDTTTGGVVDAKSESSDAKP